MASITTPPPATPESPLQRREIVEKIVSETEVRRQDVGAVTDMVLAMVRDAMIQERKMNLPALGRGQVRRVEDGHTGTAITVRFILPDEETLANASPGS